MGGDERAVQRGIQTILPLLSRPGCEVIKTMRMLMMMMTTTLIMIMNDDNDVDDDDEQVRIHWPTCETSTRSPKLALERF